MSLNYIPKDFLASSEEKAKPEWGTRMAKMLYYSGGRYLLEGKDVNAIDKFAVGDHPMSEYRKMYKNAVRQEAAAINTDGLSGSEANALRQSFIKNGVQDDLSGIDFSPIGLLVQPLNSAIASISKMPLEVKATAIDALASEKKGKDKAILKNRQKMAQALADVAGKMGEEEFDIGGMENNEGGDELPLGLDANSAGDLDIGMELFYKLRPESAFETCLEDWAYIKHLESIKNLEIRDQFWYGVSCHRSFVSDTTGLPDIDLYKHPKNIRVARGCKMLDCSDSTYIMEDMAPTVEEFYGMFGSEIDTIKDLEEIIESWGAAQRGGVGIRCPTSNDDGFWNFRFGMTYMEFKSIDAINIGTFVAIDGTISKQAFAENEIPDNDDISISKRFAENTYCCYFVPGADKVFKFEKMDGFERKKGQEYFSPFSFHIWQSQPRSAVELCIAEVKMAQKAFIKLQHCIIKSKPPGVYIDLKFLREAINGLGEGSGYDMKSLLTLFFNHNIMIGDSTDISGNEANMMPFQYIPGGIGKEVEGYWNTIAMCAQTISKLTGINDQLTGQSANPEGLVGLQKLLVNASINSLNYAVLAVKEQYTKLFNHWGYLFMYILKHGDEAAKNAIKEMITARKADLIKDIDTVSMHEYGLRVEIKQHEEEKFNMQKKLDFAVQNREMSVAECALVERISNPKDQLSLLILIDKKNRERAVASQQAQLQAMQQTAQMQVQGAMQMEQLKGQNKNQAIVTQGKTDAELMQLSNQLGLSVDAVKNMYKERQLEMRKQGQIEKVLTTQNNQQNLDNQKAFAT